MRTFTVDGYRFDCVKTKLYCPSCGNPGLWQEVGKNGQDSMCLVCGSLVDINEPTCMPTDVVIQELARITKS